MFWYSLSHTESTPFSINPVTNSESSYSSNNSLTSGVSYIEQTVKEDGKSEIVLVAKPSAAGTASVSAYYFYLMEAWFSLPIYHKVL